MLVREHSWKFSYGQLAGPPAVLLLDALLGAPQLWGLLWPLLLSSALASSVSLLPQQPLAQALDQSYSANLCPQGSALGLKIHFGHVQFPVVLRAWLVITSCP